jgi:hypothetical protein
MKQNKKLKKICVYLRLSAANFFLLFSFSQAQTAVAAKNPAAPPQLLKRTAYKTETIDFGAGGTISIVGAPVGAISVEGWRKNSVEVTAEVEVQAASETDLALLAAVNTFVIDEQFGHIRVQTVGTYDKQYMKRIAKKFPKNLLNMPFKIDYHIKVPVFSDLEIDGGRGNFDLSNVEGLIQIKVLETNARLNLIGGNVVATFGGGSVDVTIPTANWRGKAADVQLAKGNMNVHLAQNLNAEVSAAVLNAGRIENAFAPLKPREQRVKFTDKSVQAKSGGGGAPISFTVGEGSLKINAIGN